MKGYLSLSAVCANYNDDTLICIFKFYKALTSAIISFKLYCNGTICLQRECNNGKTLNSCLMRFSYIYVLRLGETNC